jgi:hypothetical protein
LPERIAGTSYESRNKGWRVLCEMWKHNCDYIVSLPSITFEDSSSKEGGDKIVCEEGRMQSLPIIEVDDYRERT